MQICCPYGSRGPGSGCMSRRVVTNPKEYFPPGQRWDIARLLGPFQGSNVARSWQDKTLMFMDLEIWSSVLFCFPPSLSRSSRSQKSRNQTTDCSCHRCHFPMLILGCREAASVIIYEFHNCSSSIQAVHIL